MPRILDTDVFAEIDETVDRDRKPVVRDAPGFPENRQDAFRIVDEVGQLVLCILCQLVLVEFRYLFTDVARCAPQQVDKAYIFTVNIAEKIFRPLGQFIDGAQPYDLRPR